MKVKRTLEIESEVVLRVTNPNRIETHRLTARQVDDSIAYVEFYNGATRMVVIFEDDWSAMKSRIDELFDDLRKEEPACA